MTLELYYNTELGAVVDWNKDTRCIEIYIAIRVSHFLKIWQCVIECNFMTLELYYNTELGAVVDRNKDTRCITIGIAIRVSHLEIHVYSNMLFGLSLHPKFCQSWSGFKPRISTANKLLASKERVKTKSMYDPIILWLSSWDYDMYIVCEKSLFKHACTAI